MKLLQEIRFLTISTIIFMLISMFSVSYLFFYSDVPGHCGNPTQQDDQIINVDVPVYKGNSNAVKGKILFKSNCARCHYITEQQMVGPGLANIMERIDTNQLVSWVQNPKKTREKDKYFQKLFEKYNESTMPAFSLTKEEIFCILEYIKGGNQPEYVAMAE